MSETKELTPAQKAAATKAANAKAKAEAEHQAKLAAQEAADKLAREQQAAAAEVAIAGAVAAEQEAGQEKLPKYLKHLKTGRIYPYNKDFATNELMVGINHLPE